MKEFKAGCVLITSDTRIEKTVEDNGKIDAWCLSEAIVKAILAFDASDSTCSSTLASRVIEGLKGKQCLK